MNEKNKGIGIFYGVIGVATLVVAIIGATFAYFTATASNETEITGNMATVSLGLAVTKKTTAGDESGLIPMSNNMVEQAVSNKSTKGVCVDDNGNAVCQIYEIVLSNSSTAGIFVDGYVALKGGSGTPKDHSPANGNQTTMRWAQVFPSAEEISDDTTYSTAGSPKLGIDEGDEPKFTSIGESQEANGFNTANIKTTFGDATSKKKISGNEYDVIDKNYIRVSDHAFSGDALDPTETYTQEKDITSALVYNQKIDGKGEEASKDIKYYIVVWLAETGTNQTAGSGGENVAEAAEKFFQGQVKFTSAQGSEVSATFSGYARVAPTDNAAVSP